MRLSNWLYRPARTTRVIEAVERSAETGDPRSHSRWVKNLMLGRALGRLGTWRFLWKWRRAVWSAVWPYRHVRQALLDVLIPPGDFRVT